MRTTQLSKVYRVLRLVALVTLFAIFPASAQDEQPNQPILVDEFGKLSHCDFTGRIDNFLADLSHHPDHRGYVITYKPANELPGEKDSFFREEWISYHIRFRQFDLARITFIRGGYMDDHRTQLYRVPVGVSAPEPSNTIAAPKIDDGKTFLFDRSRLGLYGSGFEMGEGGSTLDEFVLESVKAREAAELAVQEAEWAAEQQQDEESTSEASDEEPVPVEEPYVEEPLTEEELLAQRFEWAEVSVAKFLSSRKKSSGVLIFYADDQRYDIAKLRAHVEEGRDRLAKKAGLKPDRFRVEFGGYRDEPEVEFWFVPAKGKAPVPTPEERKPDEEQPHHH